MRTIENRTEDVVLNVLNVFLGVALFLAPWYLGLATESAAARNAWICGGAIAVIAVLALNKAYEWEEYLNVALGLWVAVSPWALGFADVQYAMGIHVVVGLAVAAIAGIELRQIHIPRARSI
ncbi:SPW repeat protein [Methylobacterium sp. NEAU K]|uniref:SPW repeat protein n=1 Tax=Methylobacterium sp. NEAU K TaxID=3064946 RepID=UPI0027345324|nr:SPW repeat protein [Methylobacterium sp. NEAU K]MDP4003328.1 SPW repeat protein [Methylobacterium sp. NEAU K]